MVRAGVTEEGSISIYLYIYNLYVCVRQGVISQDILASTSWYKYNKYTQGCNYNTPDALSASHNH